MASVYFLKEWDLPDYYLGRNVDGPVLFEDSSGDFKLKIPVKPKSQPVLGCTISATTRLDCDDVSQVETAIHALENDDFNALCWDDLSEGTQRLCQIANDEICNKSQRLLSLWRWADAAGGGLPAVEEGASPLRLYWRLESTGQYWHVPTPKEQVVPINVGDYLGLDPETLMSPEFQKLWEAAEQEEPLAHQMLREARQLADHSPKAALLIAYSALEVGIKRHVSKTVPKATWLVEEAPTPPVRKIFTKYLAELHAAIPFEEATRRLSLNRNFDNFTKARNDLAHRGDLVQGDLNEFLRLTKNALYLLDWLQGFEWAKDRLDGDFQKAFCPDAAAT